MKVREGLLRLILVPALFLLPVPTACGAQSRTVDCGQGGAAVLAGIGSQLAFACNFEAYGRYLNRDIFTLGTDGAPSRRLTRVYAQDRDPTWSSNGREIAFSSTRDGRLNVYVMGVDGGGVRRLTSALAQEFEPAWSPDGGRIAFASGRGGAHTA